VDEVISRFTERLRGQVAELSGRDPSELDPGASFTDMGFDSLFLTQVSQDIQRAFGVKVTFRQLMESLPTLGAVAEHIAQKKPDALGPPPAPAAAATPPPVAVAPPPAMAMPGLAGLSADPSGDPFEAIVRKQLELMTQQLTLLKSYAGGQAVVAAPPPVAVAVAAKASTPPAPPPAPPPAAAAATAAPSVIAAVKGPAARRAGDTRPAHVTSWEDLDPPRREALRAFVKRYETRTAQSKQHVQAHRARHADPRTAAGFHKVWKEVVYPLVVNRSQGSKLWDVDGNEYIDLLNGFGPNFLGHAHPRVVAAIEAQLHHGFEIGPQTPLAGEAAELVCELTGMDRASFVCTGSEAVQAALRCARTYTGRDKIVMFTGDYHGNFDEVLVRAANTPTRLRTIPSAPGIPRRAVEDVIVLPYGTDDTLAILERLGEEVAAVLVEPVQSRRPELQPREFLQKLRALTEKNGTVLIFDEVVTGFRCHPGGAQAVFGVRADLATYGKVAGGNMPIGIVAGRRAVMDTFDGAAWQYGDDSHPTAGVTFFAGTFVRQPLSMAACHAMLTFLKESGPSLQEELNKKTAELCARVNGIFQEVDAPVELPHFASVMYLRNLDTSELGSLLWHHLRLHGVHALEGFPSYLTLSHTDADLDQVVEAFRSSVKEMIDAGFYPPARRRLKPTPPPPAISPTPPVKGARLGRDPDGRPAWYMPDPDHPGRHIRVPDQAGQLRND
jgi:glutamate-1-semialdehyde aminotransferase/acyl carrier protein